MRRPRSPRSPRFPLAVALTAAAAAALAAMPVTPTSATPTTAQRASALAATWDSAEATVASNTDLTGVLRTNRGLPRGFTLRVTLSGATFNGVPLGCVDSTVTRKRTALSQDMTTLTCQVKRPERPARILLDTHVTAPEGSVVTATARSSAGSAQFEALNVTVGPRPTPRLLRYLSSPDFLNADVADLRNGPNFWSPGRTENSINDDYRTVLAGVMNDWARQDSSGVLVAGDLVEGWWGTDRTKSGNFGPVGTTAEQRKALQRAAATYYPAWKSRFAQRNLPVFPAMGDHEFGDDPWGDAKLGLSPSFEAAFAKHLTRTKTGAPRFANRPTRSRHEFSAYAWRPRADVQMVTLNMFDVTPARIRFRLDSPQMQWLTQVLKKAKTDGVQWVVVQGHLPIAGPVRIAGSSGLMYEGGTNSPLWRLFRQYGVDVYLTGEVHDVTAVHRDGVLQISHGGLFQFGRTNYLVADFYADRLELTLRDFDITWKDAANGSRLWVTRPDGMPKILRMNGTAYGIGTATLSADGTLARSGILRRWQGN